MAFLELRGTKVHLVDLNPGGEHPVVMVHGLFSSLAVYYLAIAPLLALHHRVVLYDLRGHGLSERRDDGYTPEMLSEDLRELMDALGIARADIVAHSYGTTAALFTALHHPERTCRLALIEAVFLEGPDAEGAGDNTAGGAGGGAGGGDSEAALESGIAAYSASTGIPVGDAQKERIRSLSRHFHEKGRLTQAFRANHELFREVEAARLAVPTLLLYGDRSPYLDTGQMLKSHIPTARLHTAEGDHNLPVQQGEWIACHLEDFLERKKR
jgi:pimeloyl-ACP methyl ester carboxylesterase